MVCSDSKKKEDFMWCEGSEFESQAIDVPYSKNFLKGHAEEYFMVAIDKIFWKM